MELNERKLKILKAIVKDYIETAEAVGSRTISKKHDLGVSAATIRNEMADLEELGYLIQPHTSAGRVPSEKGYKLYVDSLMSQSELSDEEKILIESCINKNVNDIRDLIHETSKLLSEITNYTTVAVTKNLVNQSVIKHIQLVSMSDNNILLIVVTDKGDIKNVNLATNTHLDQSKLNIISDNLTRKLSGKSIVDLDEKLIAFIKYEISEHAVLIDELIDALNFDTNDDTSISLSGATNIFNYPEFNDVLKAKSFLHMLEHKEMISSMAKSKGIQKDNVNIIIGSDNDFELAQDCSIVTATYNISRDLVGRISFIGPTRMDYAKIYTIVNYMSLIFNKK
ncbi:MULTISPECIES: heat-inducible transcriptional repressor HrcA [Romboutsia]|uniref:Heat-inducible transcription repressor HrcA n=1 Tax=Romboutsia hominis TaxID=1507512 RepID=A0A2P2BSY8_9FIRM|nr:MULTISPECIES: heat-inducible transcriptional repressor HrcA [Romboutsia]MCH1959252.1 heat-inducible transcriptional repressor HrcA [Romboutsia hominis]MCH1970151.1 heat-inducible transcriptional repressor HrcA [Romboutsia hominis]MDB8804052.1 heat-inducible transcriptional repressor HrcA [Romboutsia sp. 1001216sp1]MDB8807230.1 heat-inducible transcriptional repressor HrcA [Romboutsia sp. 1001216sp1]MDB8809698.1 heat-inducible transcriptional repressor HrcA [Romboutsia sp. 1001216sp1]